MKPHLVSFCISYDFWSSASFALSETDSKGTIYLCKLPKVLEENFSSYFLGKLRLSLRAGLQSYIWFQNLQSFTLYIF